jgi:hypothetical protein
MTEFIKIPITYAPKEKMLARVGADPGIDRQVAIQLPLMSFEMLGLSYDGSRKLTSTGRSAVIAIDKNSLSYQYNPVPYNFNFKLYIMVKNAEDGTKIVEQILPYFTPEWSTTVDLIPEMNISHEIPLVLNNITTEDSYDGNFATRRSLTWVLDFTMKGFIYGPVKTQKTIKFTNTSFYTPSVPDGQLFTAVGNTTAVTYTTIQPGLTANGQPTSNAALSIDPNLIIASDDYGYVINTVDITI